MSGPYEWVWEPGFSFEVTHIAGDSPVALEVGFGRKPKRSQLMFMVKTTAPKEWVALSGEEVRLLDDILEFFEAHRVYFTSWRSPNAASDVVVCSKADYDSLMDALNQYSSLSEADEVEAEKLLEKSEATMTKEAYLVLEVLTTFVDQANIISHVAPDDPEPFPPEAVESDESVGVDQREQVDMAVQEIIGLRKRLVAELDALST
jgi:hypothetical protein